MRKEIKGRAFPPLFLCLKRAARRGIHPTPITNSKDSKWIGLFDFRHPALFVTLLYLIFKSERR